MPSGCPASSSRLYTQLAPVMRLRSWLLLDTLCMLSGSPASTNLLCTLLPSCLMSSRTRTLLRTLYTLCCSLPSTILAGTVPALLVSHSTRRLHTLRTQHSLVLHTLLPCIPQALRSCCCMLTLLDTPCMLPTLRASSILLDTLSCCLLSRTRTRPDTAHKAGLALLHSMRLSRCSCRMMAVLGSSPPDTLYMLLRCRVTQTRPRTRSAPDVSSDSTTLLDTPHTPPTSHLQAHTSRSDMPLAVAGSCS